MRQTTIVIIKGNPRYITNNVRADRFYEDLRSFFTTLDCQVLFDAGEPYTLPLQADMWVGHSRGADRLRFAPKGTTAVGIGVPLTDTPPNFPIINHSKDEMCTRVYKKGDVYDDTYHYTLTNEMKEKLSEIIFKMRKSATSSDRRA